MVRFVDELILEQTHNRLHKSSQHERAPETNVIEMICIASRSEVEQKLILGGFFFFFGSEGNSLVKICCTQLFWLKGQRWKAEGWNHGIFNSVTSDKENHDGTYLQQHQLHFTQHTQLVLLMTSLWLARRDKMLYINYIFDWSGQTWVSIAA